MIPFQLSFTFDILYHLLCQGEQLVVIAFSNPFVKKNCEEIS